MDRQQHLDWCKQRAYEYLDRGEVQAAFDSFASDVMKHDETKSIARLLSTMSMPMLMMGQLSTVSQMRKHIAGFN